MLPLDDTHATRESSSSMNISISKEDEPTKLHINGPISPRALPRVNILHKKISKQLSYRSSCQTTTTGESTSTSTCESSGVSMQCSEEFATIEKNEDLDNTLIKARNLTPMTSRAQSGSLLPSSASEATASDDSEAIYYFGYGPIVNPIVRYRRGCMIPPQNIRTAILYDHRLKFVPGGTANIVKSRGWDVKGVLLRFENEREWEGFRQYDANYDVKDISVSLIDKTNLDPKKKNDRTAPFEACDNEDDLDMSGRSGLVSGHRMHRSCFVHPGNVSVNMSLNNLSEDSSSEEEDYSCPFSFEPKSAKVDPNAVKCKTFFINDETQGRRHVINENASFRSNRSNTVVGKPQERYLKLMTDGLRMHGIDETYICDEILAVNYIPNERDKVVDQKYRSFPNAKKIAKVTHNKYETKLCKSKENSTLFVIGTKIIRVDGPSSSDLQNPCIRWLRALGHGKGDMTLLVHRTFIDKDVYHIEPVDTPDAITEEHQRWAEHVVFLYLERGGLQGTVLGELTDSKPGFGHMLSEMKGKKVWSLKKGKNKGQAASATEERSSAAGSPQHFSQSPKEMSESNHKTKRGFGGALGRIKKTSKNSKS